MLLFLLTAVSILAVFTPDNPIDEVRLKDGQVLKNVKIMSFSPGVVMAKWDGGRGTIRFDQMPDELREKLAPWRPAERAAADSIPRVSGQEIPADVRQQADAVFNRIPKMDSTKIQAIPVKTGSMRSLRGQCFVTTKGGQNYKLGGVTVQIFSKDEFVAYEVEIRRRNENRTKALEAESKAANARKDYGINSILLGMMLSDFYDRWSALPNSEYSVETDADGNFSLTHRVAGDYVVFARATRAVFDKTEYYVWHVNSDNIANPDRFFLANANME